MLNNAQANKSFHIKCVRIGDGYYSGDYKDIQEMVNPLYDVSAEFHHNEDKLIIDADINSDDHSGYYLREVALIAIDENNNEVVYAYDNADDDADLIVGSGTVTYETRLRFCFMISNDISVSIEINSSVYALAKDVETQFKNINDQFLIEKQKNDILVHLVDKALFTESPVSLFEQLDSLNSVNESIANIEECIFKKIYSKKSIGGGYKI